MVKIADRVEAAPSKDCPLCKTALSSLDSYPTNLLDLLIFHRIHFHMMPDLAVKSYRQLGSEFVDWNEVRISPIREIQEQVSKGHDSLQLSVFIKDLLEFVHHDKHTVGLESLAEENLTDIRRYLKQVRNMELASIDLALMLRKDHPVLPLTGPMEEMFLMMGLVREADSRDRKEKKLFELFAPDVSAALAFHHLALNHCRGENDLKEAHFESPKCSLRQIADEFGKKRKRKSAASKRAVKTTKKKTTKKNARV